MTAVGRIALLAAAAACAALPASAGEIAGGGPLRIIASTDRYRPVDYPPIRLIDGRLHFSQYDNTGNSCDLLSLGFDDDFSPEIVARGIRNGTFLARDERYLIVVHQSGYYGLARPLQVVDRATGRTVGEIRLRDRVLWGRILGGRLLLVQGGGEFSPARGAAGSQAVEFELPELTRTRTLPFWGGREIVPWRAKWLSLSARDVSIYDNALVLQGDISFGPPEAVDFGTHKGTCEAGPLRVAGDLCMVGVNCGEIRVIDLQTRKPLRTIARDSLSVEFAVVDGLLVSIPRENRKGQESPARVHDLATGRLLAAWRMEPGYLFSEGKRLLVVRPARRRDEKWVLTLYEVDTESIRAGKWRSP